MADAGRCGFVANFDTQPGPFVSSRSVAAVERGLKFVYGIFGGLIKSGGPERPQYEDGRPQ